MLYENAQYKKYKNTEPKTQKNTFYSTIEILRV